MISGPAVVALLSSLRRAGVEAWVAGGWGVDALLGTATREHADVDIAISQEDEAAALEMLLADGFAIEVDWRPVRVEVAHPDGRRVDVHPLLFGDDGTGIQRGFGDVTFTYPPEDFVSGAIAGTEVPCISAALQLQFHLGYEPGDKDRADMGALASAGLIELVSPYA